MPVDPHERAHAYRAARARANGGRPRTRVWAAVLAPDPLFCALCGLVIDKSLPRAPVPHPWSATVDHIVEIVDGGDPLDPDNLQPAHRTCNGEKEARRRAQRAIERADGVAREPGQRRRLVGRPPGPRPDPTPIVGADP